MVNQQQDRKALRLPSITMKPTDITKVRQVSDPHIHPDGHRIAFVVTSIDIENDRYTSAIWLWEDEARQLTRGLHDSAPRWSPDGRSLAFIRKGSGKTDRPQLAVMPSDGGEARVVTDFELGVRYPSWAPDGSSILLLATSWYGEWIGLDDDERSRKPRRISGFDVRLDDVGWLNDRRTYAYLIDPAGEAEPRRLGSSDEDESDPVWSPDGEKVTVVTSRDNPRSLERGAELVEIEVKGGGEETRAWRSGFFQADYDPSGALYGIGSPAPDYPYVCSLWRVGRPPEDITGHLDRSINGLAASSALERPIWLDQGFLTGMVDRGRAPVVEFDRDGEVSRILEGDRYITGLSRSPSGRLAFTATTPTCPGELYELTSDGDERCLTRFNQDIRSTGALVEPDLFQVESAPGVMVDTWVYLPEGEGPFPVLLNIHGGPASEYGFYFFDEFQIYVSAGYAVVAANPRGSEGQGHDWLRAVTGEGWGKVDMQDITAVVDDALRRYPRLDPDRIGIMGGSYGGFLTAWAIARDDRYRSAVVERALTDWESFSGTSDINRDFSGLYLHPTTAGDHEALWQAGPLAYADRINTPTLIIHSEKDLRCPIGQGEQLFTALLRNGIEVEMIRFPDEGHELSRSGSPRHRVERFEYILDWHARYLREATAQDEDR